MAHIATVKLKAFKSVGGAWLEVRLDRGLNAIVGPNGCGKSSLLDAVCFAFAAPLKTFGGLAALGDLQNSDSNEVCEVCIQLHNGSGAGREVHTVHAALTPDGSRAFKVNGRNKSGKEVRSFLRSLGIRLDSAAAVIKQAQVTRLADSNNPVDLAAVVAEASGLGRWNEEVGAASEELKRTRKALTEVQASLMTMEQGVAADEAKFRALERLEQLEQECASLAQQLAGMLQVAVGLCSLQAAAGVVDREAAAGSIVAARQVVQQWREEVDAAKQQLAAAQQQASDSGGTGGSGSTGELLLLQQQLAAAEEEVRLLADKQQKQQQLGAELQQQRAAVQQLTAARSQAAAELAACQQAQHKVEAGLQMADSTASVQALQASLAAEEQQLTAAVAAKQQALAAAAAAAEESSRRLLELQADQQRLQTALPSATISSGLQQQQQQQLVALQVQQQQQQQRSQVQQLQQQEQRLHMEAGMLAARLSSSTGSGRSASSSAGRAAASWRPLYQCFAFKEPQRCQQYAQALQVLVGKKLGVGVADNMEAAGKLLAAGGGTRIWPLDSLVAADHQQQQRHAAQHFPEGQVLLPPDLLLFDAAHRPAILRAFGTHVIAATDAVAEQLITRFGIPSVTPDGRVASRGTLQGGWRGDGGSGGKQQTPMHLKISLAAAEQQLAAVQRQAEAAQAALASTQQQLLDMQQQQDGAEEAAAELAATGQDVQACQLQLRVQRAAQADAEAALSRLQADLAAKQQMLASLRADECSGGSGSAGKCGGRGSGGGTISGARAALQREQLRLAAAAAELQTQAAVIADDLAAAGARLAAVEDELALFQPDSWAEQLDIRRAELAAATSALLTKQADLAVQAADVAATEQQVERLGSSLVAAQQALAAAEAEAAALQAAAEQLAGEQQELQQQLDLLLQEVPELQHVLQAAGSSGGAAADLGISADTSASSSSGSVAALRKHCTQLAKQRCKLLEERKRSSAARMPLADQLRFREQQAGLAASKQQVATLQTAAQRLQEGIHGSNSQVLQTNEAVFEAIQSTFQSLIAAVLPAYRVRLRKVGHDVHEGVRLQFAHKDGSNRGSGGRGGLAADASASGDDECGAAEGGDSGGSDGVSGSSWRSGLDALSGGQRTMVSLTFVIAAAMAGAATSVFLMDEVDAALDETNQHLVACLFDTLSSSASAACTQVLCVSHNAAFQQLCGHVVKLTRGPKGTVLAEGGGGSGGRSIGGGGSSKAGPGGAATAEAAGRTKKARSK